MKCSTCGMKECCGGALQAELAKYKQLYPIVHDKMKVCAEKFKEQQAELSRYRQAVKVMQDALDVLKVAVNDKQPDPSAVNFISKTQREADRILKGGSDEDNN